MGIPKVFSMVLIRASGPLPKAALILLGPERSVLGAIPESVTKVSRGMDRVEAVPAAGSTWTILMVTLRWPPALVAFPNCWASAAVSPARLSEPISSTLYGWPSAAATQEEHGLEETLLHS